MINYKKNRKIFEQEWDLKTCIIFRRQAKHYSFSRATSWRVIPASLKLNTLDVPASCWHANRPRVFERWCRTNRAIAKIERSALKRKRGKRPRAELTSLQVWCREASRIERSYRVPRRRGRPVLSEISWPSSRGHSSRRTSPTSLYLDAARKRLNKKKSRGEGRDGREDPVSFRFFKCHESSLFFLVSAVALETRRSFLDT